MIKNKIKSVIAYITVAAAITVNCTYAENVDIDASVKSWKYDKVLKVELNSTNPKSKTFFSFDPNGTPNDAFAYTWTILIKKSSSLVYFTFIDTKNESKIKQEDYVISYSDEIKLSKEVSYKNESLSWAFIINTSTEAKDISFWEVKLQDKTITIPDWTIIPPSNNYELKDLVWTGNISLLAPDGILKDSTEIKVIVPEIKSENKVSTTKKTVAKAKIKSSSVAYVNYWPVAPMYISKGPKKDESVQPKEEIKTDEAKMNWDLAANNANITTTNPTPEKNNPQTEIKPSNNTNSAPLPINNPNDILKASVKDSKSDNKSGVVIFLTVVWAATAVWIWRKVLNK